MRALTTEVLYTLHDCPGVIRCLRCEHWFKSWHVQKNRVCSACTRVKSREGRQTTVMKG